MTARNVHVIAVGGGGEFQISVYEGHTIDDLKNQIKKDQNLPWDVLEMKLLLGDEVLTDEALAKVNEGDSLILARVERMGITNLLVKELYDDCQWHSKHKFVLRSDPLPREIEKVEVTVGKLEDQGWGDHQARLFLYLYDANNNYVASTLLFGPTRIERNLRKTLGPDVEVVSLAQDGMFYKLRYQLGGGGGHEIRVNNWLCKIFPKDRTTDEVFCVNSTSLSLNHTSRLGPDKVTGKWEKAEAVLPKPGSRWKVPFFVIGVHEGSAVKSPELPEKLCPGAIVEEVEIKGDTLEESVLRYRLVSGSGPSEGWVPLYEKGFPKRLLTRSGPDEINPMNRTRSASSVYRDEAPGIGHNRGMLDSDQAWSAKVCDENQWYEIDLEGTKQIKGVVLQGRGSSCQNQYIKSFSVQVDGNDVDGGKVFDGFVGEPAEGARMRIAFSTSVQGQKLRFRPVTWNSHISLRLGVMLEEIGTEATPSKELNPGDEARSASSVYADDALGKGCHRGMLDSPQAWSAKVNDANQWYEIDLGETKIIKGVVLQRRKDVGEFIKSFSVQVDAKDVEEGKLFDGFEVQPTSSMKKWILFSEPVPGQKVRLRPASWEKHISFRLGILTQEAEDAATQGDGMPSSGGGGYPNAK